MAWTGFAGSLADLVDSARPVGPEQRPHAEKPDLQAISAAHSWPSSATRPRVLRVPFISQSMYPNPV